MSTFRRYLRIQLAVFVCGIVGPLFLLFYFSFQPDPTVKWMYWIGLVVTAADVLIALAITNAGSRDEVPRNRDERRISRPAVRLPD